MNHRPGRTKKPVWSRGAACRRALRRLDELLAENVPEDYEERIDMVRLNIFGTLGYQLDWAQIRAAEKILAILKTPEAEAAREAKARYDAELAQCWRNLESEDQPPQPSKEI